MPYFGEPVGRVKIQTTSKNSQRYYTLKCLIRDLLSNTPNWYVRASEFRGYLFTGNGDRSMRSGTDLELEIKLTDWSMAGNLSKWSSGVQIPCDICTLLKRYLYSAKCSWIIKLDIELFRVGRTLQLKILLTTLIFSDTSHNTPTDVFLYYLSRIPGDNISCLIDMS